MNNLDHNFKKKYGQNFLIDDNIIKKIISVFSSEKEDLVIEIGPGSGMLTKELAKKSKVLAYEIDKDLENILLKNVDSNNLTVIWDDFLNRKISEDIKKFTYNKLFVVANLPYYITTPIIMKIIEEKLNIEEMVLMVQKEVGDRFSSPPGNKNYGSITVFLNYYFEVRKLFDVSRNCFYPKPNVDSVIISLKAKKKEEVVNEEKLFRLIKDSFKFKRKTLRNNLNGYDLKAIENILKEYNFDLSVRAEQLPLEIFIKITNIL
ncbi:MAG: 16S rRNA (adenine(1518)-N(6)/adenine(1519)-N(6))-dimethyltransferase RsmA [Bacilli bacterium]